MAHSALALAWQEAHAGAPTNVSGAAVGGGGGLEPVPHPASHAPNPRMEATRRITYITYFDSASAYWVNVSRPRADESVSALPTSSTVCSPLSMVS